MLKKICIQGPNNSLSAGAAHKFFGEKIELLPCRNALLLLSNTKKNIQVHAAILPIENSVSGSILRNYKVLQKSNLKVTGEIYMETENNNYSRFLIVQRKETNRHEVNKTSLYFETDHHPGSLMRALSIIERAGINISKLQSASMPERVWVFAFYADMEFSSLDDFMAAVDRLKDVTENLFIYGIYKKGQQPVYS